MANALTEEQKLIVASMKELMTRENWDDYFKECDNEHKFPERFCKALAELGLHQIVNPVEYGGLEEDAMVTFVAAWEEVLRLGGNAASIWFSTTYPVLFREGTEEQIKLAEEMMATGLTKIGNAATEPGAGSDLGAMKTNYVRKDGKVYINGQKTFCTDATYSDYIIVTALDAETMTNYTNWLVPTNAPGVTISGLEKLGLKTNSAGEIYLDNVEVEEKDMIGAEGAGFSMQKDDFNQERIISGLYCYGYALCAFEDAAKYANQRIQFGEAIGRTELIQLKLANMKTKLTNMKHMVYTGAEMVDAGTLDKGYAAMCKYYCVTAAQEVTDDALQILAGVGICGDHRASRAWRDIRASRVSGGTDEMMILTLGRSVLKEYRG
ncbi:crotonobetainyl-CoA--carnitine CoA-transferase [Pseudodesulfovibrio sp. JC047]|uniref:acyl-CoA dehydrogenase family protein n=1 Tax=Pseudodesulfovibrio sp. JC047 TaxID=2683199 RepID=UPI0013D85C88|nr:acyl-CoA dehydrogenase family protein [Pseudodesulfovibrio sp. JC047]NDV18797.1 crotonobetainyl-CoA--carnitine CoA-transferase [Pseudodesulfovibrio sp. JC047]